MKQAAITALGAVLIPTLLYVFYSAVRTDWPNSYVSASKDVGLIINRSVVRYLAFLFLPVYLVTLIVATTVARFHGSATGCAAVAVAIHLGRTQVAYYVRRVRRIANHTRLPLTLVAIAATVVTGVAGFLGSLGPGPFPAVVPPVDEFFKSLWTTILVAMLAVFAVNNWPRDSSSTDLAERSRTEVGPDLLMFARAVAREHDADPVLVEGVLLAENLQRPGWVRRLERLKGRLRGDGTYGVMQVRAGRPLNDHESITRAVTKFFAGVVIPRGEWGSYERDDLEQFLWNYNPSANFVEVAGTIIYDIEIVTYPDEGAEESPEPAPTDKSDKSDKDEIARRVVEIMAAQVASPEASRRALAALPPADLKVLAEALSRLPADIPAQRQDS